MEEVASLSSFPVFSSGVEETELNYESLIATNRCYQKMLQGCLNRIELALMENRERQATPSRATDQPAPPHVPPVRMALFPHVYCTIASKSFAALCHLRAHTNVYALFTRDTRVALLTNIPL